MTLESDLSRIEAALAAGPTKSPWSIDKYGGIVQPNGDRLRVNGVAIPCGYVPRPDECFANGQLLAACNPDAIRRLVMVANLTDQVIGALRLAAVILPPGTDRTIIVAAIDALVAAKE